MIVVALRSPIGKKNGTLSHIRGDELAAVKIDHGCSPMLALLADELPAVANSA